MARQVFLFAFLLLIFVTVNVSAINFLNNGKIDLKKKLSFVCL